VAAGGAMGGAEGAAAGTNNDSAVPAAARLDVRPPESRTHTQRPATTATNATSSGRGPRRRRRPPFVAKDAKRALTAINLVTLEDRPPFPEMPTAAGLAATRPLLGRYWIDIASIDRYVRAAQDTGSAAKWRCMAWSASALLRAAMIMDWSSTR
jgi:hypothetical protein